MNCSRGNSSWYRRCELAETQLPSDRHEASYNTLSRIFRRRVDYRIKRGLRLGIAVKQQRIICSALHRPIVLPRILVGDAPKCHAGYESTMLPIRAEKVCETLAKFLLNGIRQSIGIRIELRIGRNIQRNIGSLARTRRRQHIDI